MKRTCFIITILIFSMLQGCVSLVTYDQATKARTKPTYSKIDEDIIRKIGYKVKVTNNNKTMIMFGDKYSYLITKGAEKIELISQLQQSYINFEEITVVDVFFTDTIQTHLDFDFIKPSGDYNDAEKAILNQICRFKRSWTGQLKTYYKCGVSLTGQLYHASPSITNIYDLDHGQKVELRKVETETYKEYSDLMVLPLSLAIDVVTLPLQILGTVN